MRVPLHMKQLSLLITGILIFNSAFSKLPDLIPYRQGDRWGYCDSTKKIIIPCVYREAGLFIYGNNDSARVTDADYKSGYLLKNGDFHPDPPPVNYGNNQFAWNISLVNYPFFTWTLPVPPGYDSCDYIFPVKNDSTGLYGYVNCHHKLAVPYQYLSANDFSDGLALVQTGDYRYGYIDKKGKLLFKFDNCMSAESFFKGFATVQLNSGTGLVNKKGEFVVIPMFSTIENYDHLVVASSGEYSPVFVFDHTGKLLFNYPFYSVESSSDGIFMAYDNSAYGYFDAKGKLLTPLKFPNAFGFSEGMAAVSDSTQYWGFIGSNGRPVIPLLYSEAKSFENGFAAVADSSGNWGFIDKTGKTVIPFKYGEPEGNNGFSSEGLCKMGSQGYIDFRGTEYWVD